MRTLTTILVLTMLSISSFCQTGNSGSLPYTYANRHELLNILESNANWARTGRLSPEERARYIEVIDSTIDRSIVLTHVMSPKKLLVPTDDTDFEVLRIDELESKKKWNYLRRVKPFERWKAVYRLLQLHEVGVSEFQIESNLSYIKFHATLQFLLDHYQGELEAVNYNIPRNLIERNIKLIANRLDKVEREQFSHYKSQEASIEKVKSVLFYTNNDVLLPIPRVNQDRELSGGGGLIVNTDYFKSRWVNLGWLTDLGVKRPVMTYQSVGVGARFYTPYIRYRNSTNLADSLFQHDRPFGSFVYGHRDKFRLWPKGLIRQHGSFKVGMIGTNIGRDIQAMLHRDAVVSSQKVHGWDKQIANGGRWVIQFDQAVDLLLLSSSNRFRSIFVPSRENTKPSYMGLNLIMTTELHWGGYLTAGGLGLKLSLLDFTKTSGQNALVSKKMINSKSNFGFNAELSVRYRRVQHNSMLEGIGYWHTFIDDKYDDEAPNVYVLNQDFNEEVAEARAADGRWNYGRVPNERDQLNRNVFLFDLRLNLKFRRMIAHIEFNVTTKEYQIEAPDYRSSEVVRLLEDPKNDFGNYNRVIVPELERFNSSPVYGGGVIGITWLVGSN